MVLGWKKSGKRGILLHKSSRTGRGNSSIQSWAVLYQWRGSGERSAKGSILVHKSSWTGIWRCPIQTWQS
jgi:hypothetical protein